ncbi:hypothetical protein Q3G72_015480 [Acer saccharum]|nr:hypothetical protein Q3G72_015480 [Acer saccharum]
MSCSYWPIQIFCGVAAVVVRQRSISGLATVRSAGGGGPAGGLATVRPVDSGGPTGGPAIGHRPAAGGVAVRRSTGGG